MRLVASGASIHVGLQLLQAAIGLLFTVWYARTMTPAEYGAIVTYTSLCTLCSVVVYLSVREKAYFAHLEGDGDASLMVSSIVWFVLAVAAVVVPLAIVVALVAPSRQISGLSLFPYLICAQASALGLVLVSIRALSFQASERLAAGASVNFGAFLLFAGANVAALLTAGMNSRSYVYAHAGSYVISGLIALVYTMRRYGARFSSAHVRRALEFSVPLVPHHTAHWARASADRVILSSTLTTAATGVYGLAAAYCAVPLLVVEAFGLAYGPWFFRMVRDPVANAARICSVLPISVGAFALLATAMAMFAEDIFTAFAATEYLYAAKYAPLLLTSVPLFVAYTNCVVVLMFRQRTSRVAAITLASSFVGLAPSVLFIHEWGAWAVAAGVVLLNACMAALIGLFARRELDLPWPWASVAPLCALPLVGYLDGNGSLVRALALWGASVLFALFLVGPYFRRFRASPAAVSSNNGVS
jgi:O-antigen/teichoic acid export membrane protein